MNETRYQIAFADWGAVKDEIRAILVLLAKTRRTISYSDLAAQIRTAYMHHRAPAFHELLREVCRDEMDEGRPSLGVLVVKKQTGFCGAGFFKFAAASGQDVSDPEVYWRKEFERVCGYWSEH
jgi:hypothetical protein